MPFPTGPAEDPNLPPPHVDLPAIPDLSKAFQPVETSDGHWTVHGVRTNVASLKGRQATVRAHVVGVYVCPNPEVKEPPCQVDHFWIADDTGTKADRMMVVGYDATEGGFKVPKVETVIVVSGEINTQEADGFVDSDGLLILQDWKAAAPE